MLTINNMSFHFGSRTLYDEVNWQIKPGEKIGLIGLNGTGKSTLLRLLAGEYQPDGGEISRAKDCSIAYLNQDLLSLSSDKSILSVAMEAFDQTMAMQKKIDELIKKLETNYEEDDVHKLTSLQEKFEQAGGYALQSKTEAILEGLGFNTSDLSQPLNTFSGGWRMRVILAKMLLQDPALLLLDEPTNHLDLPSIQWLEEYLKSADSAVVIVSHDREFLDRSVNVIVEVANANLTRYSGNYSFYLKERELRREIQQNAFENQQKQIKQTEKFIERFRSKATKATQVQSRVKALEKMDKVDEVIDENPEVNIRFQVGKQPGKEIMNLDIRDKSYGEKQVLHDSSLMLMRGDKIGLIGANGKGKSTLLRILNGLEPFKGERKEGHNVMMSFYAQHQLEALDIEQEILDELKQSGSGKTEQELRSILGAFLFSDEDVFKKIKVLSGGEKSRVALAKTLIDEGNFLLLDEPTNHLDMQSVNVLVQALEHYEGTYIVVSHDRYFVEKVANKIWYIEDKKLKEYPGTFHEYNNWMNSRKTSSASQKESVAKKKSSSDNNKKPKKPQDDLLKKLEKELEKIERNIESLEKEQKALELKMGDENLYKEKPEEFKTVSTEHERNRLRLENLHQQWEELANKIEA